jgi:hypothetical protein
LGQIGKDIKYFFQPILGQITLFLWDLASKDASWDRFIIAYYDNIAV